MFKRDRIAAVVPALVFGQQSNERSELNARLAGLVAKRDACIAAQQAKKQPRTTPTTGPSRGHVEGADQVAKGQTMRRKEWALFPHHAEENSEWGRP